MKSSKIIEMFLIFLFHENLFPIIIIELDVDKVNMLLEPLQVDHCVEGHVYSSDAQNNLKLHHCLPSSLCSSLKSSEIQTSLFNSTFQTLDLFG